MIHFKKWGVWLVTLLAALLYIPILADYFVVLQHKDYYKFWPILLLVVGVMFAYRWRNAPKSEVHVSPWVNCFVVVVALTTILFSWLYYVPWFASVSWVLLMGAGALYLSGYRKITNIWGLWFLLVLFIRPPYQLSLRLMSWMENLSVQAASSVLDYGSVKHVIQGDILALPEYDLHIEAMCSGWFSLVSMIATAAVIAVLRNRRLLHTVALFGASVVAVWALNTSRILISVTIYIWYHVDLLQGVYLFFYQLFSFLMGMVLVLSADALVAFLLVGGDASKLNDVNQSPKGIVGKIWILATSFELSSLFRKLWIQGGMRFKLMPLSIMVLALITLIGLEGVVLYYRPKVVQKKFMYGEGELSKISKESVIFNRAGWQNVSYSEEKRDFGSIWGALSNTWRLKYNGLMVIMSLDYPFDNWHDVKRCYKNIGWKISSEKILVEQPIFNWGASETNMTLPNGDAAYVLCSHCDHLGNTVEPKPATHRLDMLLYRFHPDRMTAPFGTWSDKATRTFYQTQCMVATPLPLDEATKEEIRIMYAQFREQTRKAIEIRSRQN